MFDAGVAPLAESEAPIDDLRLVYKHLSTELPPSLQIGEVDKLALAYSQAESNNKLFKQLCQAVAPNARRTFARWFPGIEPDEVKQTIDIAIVLAARTYDPTKASFVTHLNYKLADERKRLRLASHPLGKVAARKHAAVRNAIFAYDTVEGCLTRHSDRGTLPRGSSELPFIPQARINHTPEGLQLTNGVDHEEHALRVLKLRIVAEFLTDYEMMPRRRPHIGRRNRLIAEAILLHEVDCAEISISAAINRERVRQIVQEIITAFPLWCRENYPDLETAANNLPEALSIATSTNPRRKAASAPVRCGKAHPLVADWSALDHELNRLAALIAPEAASRAAARPVTRMAKMRANRSQQAYERRQAAKGAARG